MRTVVASCPYIILRMVATTAPRSRFLNIVMPLIDTELVQPLTAVADILLKRPGVVTMSSIKRLSEMYGFTTFVEHMKNDSSKGGNTDAGNGVIVRLSIAGLVLLIDVDFLMPMSLEDAQKMVSSPSMMSLTSPGSGGVSTSKEQAHLNLRGEHIKGVYISSAITADPIDGKNYNFLFSFDGSKTCSDVLYANLKEKTLDSFNMNLRLLLLFDRLSKEKPDDLFTTFSQLVYGLKRQQELEKNALMKTGSTSDIELQKCDLGLCGTGKVLANHDGKIGVFLNYWIDNWEVNQWLRTNKGLDVEDTHYMLHFKVNEQMKVERTKKETSDSFANNGGPNSTADTDVKMTNGTDEQATDAHNENSSMIDNEGKWHLTSKQQENFSTVMLECCPPVWVPEDVISKLCVDYEVIHSDNANWPDNYVKDTDVTSFHEYNALVNRIYIQLNDSEASFGCVNVIEEDGEIEVNNGEKKQTDTAKYFSREEGTGIRVELQTGCPMVRVFKLQTASVDGITPVVQALRIWTQSASVLRQLASSTAKVVPVTPSSISANSNGVTVELGDVFGTTNPVPEKEKTEKKMLVVAVTENGVRVPSLH